MQATQGLHLILDHRWCDRVSHRCARCSKHYLLSHYMILAIIAAKFCDVSLHINRGYHLCRHMWQPGTRCTVYKCQTYITLPLLWNV